VQKQSEMRELAICKEMDEDPNDISNMMCSNDMKYNAENDSETKQFKCVNCESQMPMIMNKTAINQVLAKDINEHVQVAMRDETKVLKDEITKKMSEIIVAEFQQLREQLVVNPKSNLTDQGKGKSKTKSNVHGAQYECSTTRRHDNEFMRGEFELTVDSFECQTLCNQEYNENEVYDSFEHHASLYCD
jgi:hypothetical protein